MNISELKNIYQQKLDKVLSKKQQYLDKVEYYKEKIEDLEKSYLKKDKLGGTNISEILK